jgi:amidase
MLQTNCLTEILFDAAVARAAYLDKYQADHDGKVIGPLHGLPISLKDQFPTPPHPSSLGIASLAMIPTTSEMPLLIILRDMGAVFYVKTNVPTALMMMETKNNVYGETLNPINTSLSPGGSSGGESALLAMKGSPLGLGTEIGGSTRHPAAWTHLYALKPSTGRLPMGGLSDHPFSTVVLATIVPIARSLETIRVFYQALLSQEASPWLKDPSCLPMPWKEGVVIQPAERKLRFGITGVNDGVVTVHPPVERALRMTRLALEQAGHEVIDW